MKKMNSLFRLHRIIPLKCWHTVRPMLTIRSFTQPADADDEPEMIDQRRLPADYDPSNFDPTEHRSPPTARVWRLVDEVAGLTLTEVSELSAILARKLAMKEPLVVGVMKAGAVAAVNAAGGGAAAKKEEAKPEKTVYELRLESFDSASKLKVIKEIRGVTNLGLKEAKDLVEKAPTVFKAGVSKEEGGQIAEKLKAVGAHVVLV